MSATPPIPQELWDKTPADAQAAVLALVQSLERRIAALEARLGQDSSNSSKPPPPTRSTSSAARPGRLRGRSAAGSGGTSGTPVSWSPPHGSPA